MRKPGYKSHRASDDKDSAGFGQAIFGETVFTQKGIPIRFLAVTVVAIFAVEALIMAILSILSPLEPWITIALDAMLIALLGLQVLYLFLLKPIRKYIAAHAQREDLLRASESKFRGYVDSSPCAIIVVDENGEIFDANNSATVLSGYSREELLAMNLTAFFPPEDKTAGMEHFARAVKTGESSGVVPIIAKDGRRGYWDVNAVKLNEHRFLGIVSDITERKQTEELLREKDRVLRESQMIARLGSYILDIPNGAWSSSDILDEIFGIDENFNRTVEGWSLLLHPGCRQSMLDYFSNDVLGKGIRFDREYRIVRHNDGQVRWVHGLGELEFDSRNQPIRMIGTISDITDRRRAEEALRESEERFRKIFEEGPLGMVTANAEFRFITANDSFCRMSGYTEQELWSLTFKDITHPDNLAGDVESIGKLLRGEIPIYRTEKRYIRKDAEVIWGLLTTCIIRDTNGQFLYFLSMVDDITERKRAELAIREAELKYRIIADNTYDWEFWLGATEKFLYVSPSCKSVTGYEASEFLKDPNLMRRIVHPDDLSAWDSHRHEAEKGHLGLTISFRILRPDFSERWIEHVCQPVYDDRSEFIGTRGSNRDITETKRLRELESRAQRLETAGQIAGQVAHDFNNLLGPMIAYPDFLSSALSKDQPALQMLADIKRAAETMADINQQLLTLSRRGHIEHKTLNLNDVVTDSLGKLESLPDTFRIETDLDMELMNIKGGASQIVRVISNLVNNAIDSMQNGGLLFIKTENYYGDDFTGKYGRVPRGEYVKVTVTDTGCGISEEILPKIFDAFFTTKSADNKRGSGLGLSVVAAVMEDHNGHIDIQTRVGRGTSFYLYFPITRDEIEKPASGEIIGGTESVLIVDDDILQRGVVLNLLEKLGYRATAVGSGEKALEFLRDNPQDIILLDMTMPPGIDGGETYRRILEINPDQKAIIISGFSESDRVLEAQKLGVGAFVRKPLTKETLGTAVRAELDRKATVSVA